MSNPKILYFDLEVYSEVNLKQSGVYRYAPESEILLAAYALDDGPVHVVETANDELTKALLDPNVTLVAHNAQFDRVVLRHAWQMETEIERWRCTMAQALAHSLPGALGVLCQVYGLDADEAKDADGQKLIQLFCKPQPANRKLRRANKETHPDEWAQFVHYARQDVQAMRVLHGKLPKWNYKDAELALWHLDQRINDRGVAVDLDLVQAAIDAVKKEKARLSKETQDKTGGDVNSASQRDALLAHILKEYGVSLPDLRTSTLERRLEDPDLPEPVKELLRIRLEASMSSNAKYPKFQHCTNEDGRLRGTLQYCGASRTGRFAGRLVQLQNLPRGSVKGTELEHGIAALKLGCADLMFDNVSALTSSAVRGCLIAPEGKKLVVSDLSNIEGRVAAWLAGEDWKVQAFREFDAGTGPDLYKMAYAKSFGVSVDTVGPDERSVGKVQELALGYQGAVGAFKSFAAIYRIDLNDMADKVLPTLPDELLEQAQRYWNYCKEEGSNTFGLERDTFVACDGVKRAWRKAHPNITRLWKELEESAVLAIQHPNEKFKAGKLVFNAVRGWLRIKMPSGRLLCYPQPRVDDEGKVSYAGLNQYTRKWGRISTYGGKIFENLCQAVARDVLTNGLAMAEFGGYAIVSSVHDELICEVPDNDRFTHEELSAIMATPPDWAKGLPLAAAGYETTRYRKE